MQSQALTLDDPADLKRRIFRMNIEGPGGQTLERALAHAQGWSFAYASKVAREYRRFLYLAATAGQEVTPSKDVDEAWHLHLTWPHYDAVLCDSILRRPLDHREGTGDPAEEARFRRQYEDTLDLYRATFGTPPRAVWPQPGAKKETMFGPIFWSVVGAAACVALLAGLFGSLLDFILLTTLLGIPIGIYALSRPHEHDALLLPEGGRRHDAGSCGSFAPFWFGGDTACDGGAGGDASGGASCGASCGGSCGGGGCGGGCGGS